MTNKPADDDDGAALREHCLYCFDVLDAKLRGTAPPSPRFPDRTAEYPLFVTWNTLTPSGPQLRGCIGTFAARPLESGLAEFALTSALDDHRFHPISQKELPSLQCGVSLLTAFEDCADYLDWTPGVHGIYTTLTRGRTQTATFLPDVIPAQGWDRTQAIDAAVRKGGWRGTVDEELRRSLRVQRYRSEKAEVGYEEWRRARESGGGE